MELPDPLVPAECDCTDLDSFMLNVEKLMASELVAISSNEIVGAAVFLWCRAWKQRPSASLPDDDRVIAAFARLPLAKFRKVRDQVLRGFVKCSDGRLYHRTLAAEAVRAWTHKLKFQSKREADAERLEKWRKKQRETQSETRFDTQDETHDETRFVAEGRDETLRDGTGTLRDGTLRTSKSKPKPLTAGAAAPPFPEKSNGGKPPAKSAAIREAYSEAYQRRYGVDPVANAKTNALLCQVVDRLGADEAPHVAAFYVGHNGQWYVKNGHALDHLVRDAEKLRTEWATGAMVTDSQARQADRTQGQANIWSEIIAEERDKERAINER